MFVVRKRGYGRGDFFIRWEKSSFLDYAVLGTSAQPIILRAIFFFVVVVFRWVGIIKSCTAEWSGVYSRSEYDMQNNLILFFLYLIVIVFFCGIQKKISIFKQLRILVVIGTWQSWKAQVNHFDPVWSSLFMIGIS